MPLEFGDDFCAACEPFAQIWHNGNDPIGHHPIAIIVVVVVAVLQEIHAIGLFGGYLTVPLTVSTV